MIRSEESGQTPKKKKSKDVQTTPGELHMRHGILKLFSQVNDPYFPLQEERTSGLMGKGYFGARFRKHPMENT